jgi:hypothetical protein
MSLISRWLCALPCAFCLSAAPVLASDFTGEVMVEWWANEVDLDTDSGSFDAGALGGHADVWFGAWGARVSVFDSELENLAKSDADFFSLDVKRRLLSFTDNNFVALGLGWEDIDLALGDSTSGVRLLAEGQFAPLPILHLYGQIAWMPALSDAGGRQDLEATEWEVGASLTPFPFLSLRGGWRQFDLDFSRGEDGKGSSKSSGPIIGAGVHW